MLRHPLAPVGMVHGGPWRIGSFPARPARSRNGVIVVSLNRRRRIFRSGMSGVLHSAGRAFAAALPSPNLMLAATVGLTVIGTLTWLIARPSDAPALSPMSQHLTAPASRLAVIDGGTLRIGEDVVRLAGITAPPRDTTCHTPSGVEQDCGVAAANALAALIRQGPIDCAIIGRDAAGRPVGDCQA